jgi:hypothetical protein
MKWILSFSLVAAMFWTTSAAAQGGPANSRYTPSRPVISPYLYFQRGGIGGLPAYQAWVQPALAAQAQQRQNDIRFGQIEKSLLRQPTPGVGQPSTAARFMDYSHYYNQRPTVSQQAR